MTVWKLGDGAGAHALVVGVGEYPWLVGGTEALFEHHEGMEQLSSAPVSARRFAEWLAQSYRSSTHPLRTLEVLLSEPAHKPWQPSPQLERKIVDRATFDGFRDAVKAWHGRIQPNDRALFFFSGHGMGAGQNLTLVFEDYGSEPDLALDSTLYFTGFRNAMARSPALEQCFFVDACRASSGALVQSERNYGRALLDLKGSFSPPRRQSTLYATLAAQAAYGRPNDTSLFTEALLNSVRGAGAGRSANGWVIRPGSLHEGIEHHLEKLARPYGATQNCAIETGPAFELHELTGLPEVPVVVRCGAPINRAQTTIQVSGVQGSREQAPPVPLPWTLELPYGSYQFAVSPPSVAAKTEHVFPPVTPVVLP
jgi:hypothetical protein